MLIYNHQARAAESARALGRPARRGLARAHRLCRPDRFRLELHRARHLLQAVGGNTDNTLAAFFRNLDGRIIADSGGVIPDVADGSCYVGVMLEENARKAIADGLDVAIVYPAEGNERPAGRRGHRPRLRARENARKFIDFLLSPDVQQLLGTELSRRSVRTDTASERCPS